MPSKGKARAAAIVGNKWVQGVSGTALACLLGMQVAPVLPGFIAVARAEASAASYGPAAGQSAAELAQRLRALAQNQVMANYPVLREAYVQRQLAKLRQDAQNLPDTEANQAYREAVGDFSWMRPQLEDAASLDYYGMPDALANELVAQANAGLVRQVMAKYPQQVLAVMANQAISLEMGKMFPAAADQAAEAVVWGSKNSIVQYLGNLDKDQFVQSMVNSVVDYAKQQAIDYFKKWIKKIIQENIITKITSEIIKNYPYIGPYISWYQTQKQKLDNIKHRIDQIKKEAELYLKKLGFDNAMERQQADMTWGKQNLPAYPNGDGSSEFGTSGGVRSNQQVIERYARQERGDLAQWSYDGDRPGTFYGWVGSYPAERRAAVMRPYVIGPRLGQDGQLQPVGAAERENVRRNAWLTLGLEPNTPFTAKPGSPAYQEELAVRAQMASVMSLSYGSYMEGWMAQDRITQLASTIQMFTPSVISGLSTGQANGCRVMLKQLSTEVQMQTSQSQLRFERLFAASSGMLGNIERKEQLAGLSQGAPIGAINGR
ncbi:hypothetical protein KIF53_17480 [Chromobacterium subtsugae]|uniref:Uncharacterized protein n=1 Tax=Chromobacterium subtsugae TaxID=251747 RepID=A0ABS7FH79_9NEIS|nr:MULTISPECIES: hypothetical protein [Chromobacterium]KUM04278.1 hypothetical protein Cv017_00545 [Chromobacterium subtsugae]KZE88356.1 hypothetical protein AWB61_00295 [Chromobacterium sp. F49]MBW7568741.1 hypothetical protein [Chromobacterium subtsugae]MBW8289429.1 hypothetical protein [Chromobacterium subtsugae]WSE90029.1 hypothetical protein U6115_14150 [Chromobacterium subtsugae]